MTVSQQPEPMSEEQIRKMRDEVFHSTLRDNGWAMCKANWMRPDSVEWLKKKLKIKLD